MHHPDEATLIAYAAGTLPEVFSIVVATHLAQCDVCRRDVAALDAVGGTMLQQTMPAEVSEDALARVLQRLDETPPVPPAVLHPTLASPLRHIRMGRWWPLVPGVCWRRLATGGRGWVVLIEGQAGRALPRHCHVGLEMTMVLTGAFRDGQGLYQAGDFVETVGQHVDSPPTVTREGPCVCLLASDGMRLTGLIGWLQRRVGL